MLDRIYQPVCWLMIGYCCLLPRINIDIFGQNTSNMCGRIFQTLPLLRLMQIARTKKCSNGELHTSSYNVCPTTYVPVIKVNRFYVQEKGEQELQDEDIENEDCRELAYMKWGAHTKNNMVINGRVQELLDKRMFVNIINNRCVVIMEGYFEWNQKKEPFSLRPKEGDHFLVAGLYTDDNQIIILTKDATPELAHVHDRMPVILSHEQVNLWMNPKNTKDIQKVIHNSLLKKDKQVWKNVGFARIAPYVNKLNDKSVKCLMTFEDYKKELDKTGLMRYWKKPPAVEAVGPTGEPVKHNPAKAETPHAPEKHSINTSKIERTDDKNNQAKISPQKQPVPQDSSNEPKKLNQG